MRNLKLISTQQLSSTKGDNFCYDSEGNVFFASCDEIYSMNKSTNEVISCAMLDTEADSIHYVVGMDYMFENNSIFIASSSGDLHLYNLYDEVATNVGIIETKIIAYAWSPDQEFLVILTGANTLVLMTKEFNPITEESLCSDKFGEQIPVNVGWGSKTTQFHGSEGKEAALVKQKEPSLALPHDAKSSRISWREDGEYFVTSSIHTERGFRQLRIWNQEAVLQSTSENVEGLEEPLSWRPSGNLIACSQQCANKHKIIFFEKNGLQHGEFVLPFQPNTHKVIDLLWNSDSKVLMIASTQLVENSSSFQIMLYTSSNYHWYLKQTFQLNQKSVSRPIVAKWSSNNPYEIHCYNHSAGEFHILNWTWTITYNMCYVGGEDATVVSIDNKNILVSPFGKMVVPPPMCAYMYSMNAPVQSVFFSPDSCTFGCYLSNSQLAFFNKESSAITTSSELCSMKLVAAGGHGFKSRIQPYSYAGSIQIKFEAIAAFQLCHWTWIKGNRLLCVAFNPKQQSKSKSSIFYIDVPENFGGVEIISPKTLVDLEDTVRAMCTNKDGNCVAVQLWSGIIKKINVPDADSNFETLLEEWPAGDKNLLVLPKSCATMTVLTLHGKDYVMGLSDNYNLYCNDILLQPKCTSYYIHEEFLLTTSVDHYLKCFSLKKDLPESIASKSVLPSEVQSQRIEKGARIVIAPSNGTKLILQMPRGNLETIHPVALVLSAICKHLDKLHFGEAFNLAKVHRIDLNLMYDHNSKIFLDNIDKIIEQISSASDLNLILASLREEDVCFVMYPNYFNKNINSDTTNKVNIICDAFRSVLEARSDTKYYHTLMATYAKKNPSELDKSLLQLKALRESNNSKETQVLVDSALNFLLYLVDINELIDVALGTYDLETTIMVAQKSQKDPKEFLPFYNNLQMLEENYRKYKIDMHLQKYKKALQHISKCDDHFEECIQLIKEQRLFIDALHLFPPSSDRFKVVWKEYGTYLMGKHYYDEAGLVFTRCADFGNALSAYKESENWQAALCSAANLNYSDDRLIYLCQELASKLKNSQRYLDASYLLEHYIKDVEESIVTLIEGHEWNMAILKMSQYRRHDIAETHFMPALKEYQQFLLSHLQQTFSDFNQHLKRLEFLRTQKKMKPLEPSIHKYVEDDMFSDVGSVSDVASSCAESKQMSGSIITRKSSKSRRKQKLKKYRLKKGSPDEDLGHMVALSEIVTKIDSLKDNFLNTLKALVYFDHDALAKELQQEMCFIMEAVDKQIPYIWAPEENIQPADLKFGPDSTSNSITASLQQKPENITFVPRDPELAAPPWRNVDIALMMFK